MKTMAEILASQDLKPYVEKTDRITKLNEAWLQVMNEEWTKHCKIANFEDGRLTLAVLNAGWATRIRYVLPEIQKELMRHEVFSFLKEIKCKVIP